MAILRFGMELNVPDSNNEYPTATLNVVTFRHPEKDISMSLSCSWESDYGAENGIFSGSFNGVETCVEGKDINGHDWEEMAREEFELLKQMKLNVINIYVDTVKYKNPLHISDVDIKVEYTNDDNYEFIEFHEDTLSLEIDGEYSENATIVNNTV